MTNNGNVLIAGEGMMLTNGSVFAKIVCLGANDRAENWQEVPGNESDLQEPASEDYEQALSDLGVSV